MNNENADIGSELIGLEEKIESLILYCQRLREENESLKTGHVDWTKERSQLVEKTAIAKNRVEAMISRLKSMGHES